MPALADRLQIPLALDQSFIESLVREQVFSGPDNSVRINDNGTGCQFLVLRNPQVSIVAGQVRLRTDAEARAGRPVGNSCVLVMNWRGQLEFDQEARVGDDRKSVLLRTVSWRALSADGQTDTLSTTVGRWLERYLPLNLQQTRISLVQPVAQLQGFLAEVVSAADAAQLNAVLDSVAVDSISARGDVMTLTLGMQAPPAVAALAGAGNGLGALSAAQLVELDSQLGALDAFITYTIKQLAADPVPPATMAALFDVLLDLRLELVDILASPRNAGPDPVRAQFVATWGRLMPILQELAAQQADHASALRYLSFIAAGDMLRVLDGLGPTAGIDLSTAGLRRLARLLAPGETADPLQRDDAVDPALRRSLGFGEPLPPPADTSQTSWLDWLVKPAYAGNRPDVRTVQKLNNWVPKTADMKTYLPMVKGVLQYAVTEQLDATPMDRNFREVFRRLVFTAAWQESCWRQFMAKNNKRMPLESGSGDIGMMQINPKVWRGFYETHGLKWDIVYNARAGADILQHHMLNYAIAKGEHKTTGKTDNLARSAYAAYNGGPRQYDRYRRRNAPAAGKKADTLFYEKYRIFSSGNELGVQQCFQGMP